MQGLSLTSFEINVKHRAMSSQLSWILSHEHVIGHIAASIAMLLNILLLLFLHAAIPELNVHGGEFRDISTSDGDFTVWRNPMDDSMVQHVADSNYDAVWGKYDPETPEWLPRVIGLLFPVLALLHLIVTTVRGVVFFKMTVPSEAHRIYRDLYPEWTNAVQDTGLTWPQYYLLLYSRHSWVLLGALFCSAGALFWTPEFCIVFMVDVFSYSKTIDVVALAVQRSLNKMIWLILLMVLFIYWFSLITMQFFWNQQNSYQRTCGTLWQCFLSMFDLGMTGGGLGDIMRSLAKTDTYPRHFWEEGDIMALVLLKVSFFIVVVFVAAAFFQAVIVDTFTELRNAGEAHAERLATECFVCGLDSARFKGSRETLEEHCEGVHSIVSFIFLAAYLRRKQGSSRLIIPGPKIWTMQELFLYNCFKVGDASFFPRGATIAVNNAEEAQAEDDEQGQDVKSSIMAMQQNIESLKEVHAELSKGQASLSRKLDERKETHTELSQGQAELSKKLDDVMQMLTQLRV